MALCGDGFKAGLEASGKELVEVTEGTGPWGVASVRGREGVMALQCLPRLLTAAFMREEFASADLCLEMLEVRGRGGGGRRSG